MKKTLNLMMAILLAISAMGQPVDIKTRINALHKPLDFKNDHGFSGKDERFEMQHPKLLKTPTGNPSKSTWTGDQKLDSTILETWDSTASQLVVSGKTVYTYDANGNNTLRIDYQWDENTSQWFTTYKTEYNYDANGNNTLLINYNWFENPADTLYKFYKAETSFDANGNETSYIGYFWVESSNDWVPSVKEEHTYDANGKDTLIMNYDWHESDSQWVAYMKKKYSYDINGNMTSVNYFIRDTANTQWIDNFKAEYAYNTGDFTTLASVNYFIRDTANAQWLANAKDEYTYEDNGSVLMTYEYDTNLSQWFNFSKIETTFDAYGNGTTFNYLWNRTHSQWDVVSKTADYYSQHNVTGVPAIPKEKIGLYPNPASVYIIFDGSNVSGSAIVELFDVEGKKVLEQKLYENKQISVSNLPKGLYMYKLNNYGIIYTGKLLIE